MNESMAHRGPNASGCFIQDLVALGHRRLSVIDTSVSANQPLTDNSGRYTIVFNGEIYNYLSIKSRLSDYHFNTTSDTEVLLAAYAKWGIECLQFLKGMFAFAVWDKVERDLTIVRDRMGVKPVYYYLDEERLIFASEVRAIVATGYVPKRVNNRALLEYFSYQSVSSPLCMIEGINQLEAGSYLKVKKGKAESIRYWNICDVGSGQKYDNIKEIKSRIKELLTQSVSSRLVSDVPVGAFLSGGIDSSAVVALMAEAGSGRPSTFNISFSEKEFDESKYAEIIASKYNTRHIRIQLSATALLDELDNALSAMDIPSGDGINSYVVSKAIKKERITVALSGIGGDELFAGYPFFDKFKKLQAKKKLWKMGAPARELIAVGMNLGSASNKRFRTQQLLRTQMPDIEYIYPQFRKLLSNRIQRDLLRLPEFGMTALEESLFLRRDDLHQLPLLSQISAAEYMGYTQNTLLKDADQMSMAVALEIREPFFDTDLVEYVLGIPDKFKQPAYPKSLLVESLKPRLPDEIVFRKKQGFVFPWDAWMRNELRMFCAEHINHMSERPFIHRDKLQQYWKRFLGNDHSVRWVDIWVFVVLEYWLQKNEIDG